ncbi:AAA domain-containing protein [Devosia neptuniae]|uniref:AAA domain-containing protein n=1 Tax=Devosia neptuniae TaxID=191302 RepID=UPI0022AEBF8F|nr:AAA domain-containing protein [Devosia neptuniae]MCZ4348034.1 AAA domain-containing protein [Devosia neptuniae]
MRIDFLNPRGPLPSEIDGINELTDRLPDHWRGFASFNMLNPRKRNQDREIDVAIIAPDRILLVDLKQLRGRIESRNGIWYADDNNVGPSAAHKIRENAKVFAELVRSKVNQIPGSPPIESFVVFTDRRANLSGLSSVERQRSVLLDDFVKIANPRDFSALCTTESGFGGDKSLLKGGYLKGLEQLFTNERHIVARETKFHGFVPVGKAEFHHDLFDEYSCHDATDPNYTGLLRVWDFGKDLTSFGLEEQRAEVAGRERTVLGLISSTDPEFHGTFVLRSREHDRDFTLRYSEVFDRHPDLARLIRFAGQLDDLDLDRRLELSRLLLDRVASLHRMRIAHRDLDRHSIWVDDRRSLVVLSNFGASHFPDVASIGAKRTKLLAGGFRVPEDIGATKAGSPFQQDVFLVGAAVWTLLTGGRLAAIDNVPIWPPETDELALIPQELIAWFDRSLSIDPADRFSSATEAAQGFADAVSHNERISLERQLVRHRREVDPLVDYAPVQWLVKRPHRVYRAHDEDGRDLLIKSWPSQLIGDIRRNAAHLLDFLSRAERLQALALKWTPRIDFACLSMDGLLLVQSWSEGASVNISDAQAWTAGQLGSFISQLIEAVEALHRDGLAHGDLKPANILVTIIADVPSPMLLDLLDYSTEEAGDRLTMAYQPPDHGDDATYRDRYAVAMIAKELAMAWTQGHPGEVWGALVTAASEECGKGDNAWETLRPLREAIKKGPQQQRADEGIALTVAIARLREPGPLLADNGKYHVVERPDHRLEIVGFDSKLEILLDGETGLPLSAKVHTVPARSAGWAARYSTLSFPGTVTLTAGDKGFSGFEALREALARPKAATDEIAPSVPTLPHRPDTGGGTRFPVARFWQETITVEEDLQPEVTLSEAAKETGERFRIMLSCQEVVDWDAMEIANGSAIKITWNGELVGLVDQDRSRRNTIVVRDARNFRRLAAGDTLRLHASDDLSSFRRRSQAVERVLTGRSQIGNLISYFDPEARIEPLRVASEIPEDALETYGLNADQREAMQHLWQFGPVGLLQGPPGTGKTKFIAAFVHWALNGGKLNNVLVLSQSHEAVNTAAERVLGVFGKLGGDLDMLRVGRYDKISPQLRKYHSQAVQDRYRELFRADITARMSAVAKRLGLPAAFVREGQEVEATYATLVRRMFYARRDIADSATDDVVTAARRSLGALEQAFYKILDADGVEREGTPEEILEELREEVARSHMVSDVDAQERLTGLSAMSRDWIAGLGGRHRNLEEFLARSRNLVSGTCVGIGRHDLRIERSVFDLVIIDEAARCTPSELAVAMQSGKRVLLVGDHRQLPPLFGHELMKEVRSRIAGVTPRELKRSDFERAFGSSYGKSVARTLKRQYRMAQEISDLVSENFYPGQGLYAERPTPDQIYDQLPAPFDHQVAWVDTSSGGQEGESGHSFTNRREAHTVIELLRALSAKEEFLAAAPETLELEPEEALIGVICMYAQQANLIEELLTSSGLPASFRSMVRVDTVDAYQGKENRIIIISLVRNNPDSSMGHVRSDNRINVALSRAMDRLVIVGSVRMFERKGNPLSPVLKSLRQRQLVRTSQQLGLTR